MPRLSVVIFDDPYGNGSLIYPNFTQLQITLQAQQYPFDYCTLNGKEDKNIFNDHHTYTYIWETVKTATS